MSRFLLESLVFYPLLELRYLLVCCREALVNSSAPCCYLFKRDLGADLDGFNRPLPVFDFARHYFKGRLMSVNRFGILSAKNVPCLLGSVLELSSLDL